MAINKSVPGIKNSTQNDVNWSFDEDFGVIAAEGLVYNPSTCTVDKMVQPGDATSAKQDSIITALTTPTGINGAPVTVGTTAVEMTFTGTTKVIAIKAASTNTGLIWFGPATVTNTGANAYGELTADQGVEIELNDAATPIYCVSVKSALS